MYVFLGNGFNLYELTQRVSIHLILACSKASHAAFSDSLPNLCALSPDAAESSSFDVQLGDIILTATDGLFDNMPDYMILQELKKLKASGPLVGLSVGVELEMCLEQTPNARVVVVFFSSSEHKLREHPADSPQHCRAGPCPGI